MKIKDIIRNSYPKIEQYPFMRDLKNGMYTRAEILKAEVVEIYRAKNTRDDIQRIYKEKLKAGIKEKLITGKDFEHMEEVIDDEGETDEHIDHFDMRFKLFTGTGITNKSKINFQKDCEEVNKAWVKVCSDSSLLYLMSAMAGIEDWYAPVSEFFEVEYRKRGFNDDELELFIVHKAADVDHSDAQFDILERNAAKMDQAKLADVMKRTFETSVAYDVLKQKFARDKNTKLEQYLG
jgi:hypothetical protein